MSPTHGHRSGNWKSPTYISYDSMIARCHRPSHPKYQLYGGRGIVVCERWRGRGGFASFLADMGERPEGLTLDRINCDGPYEQANCRWATVIVQRWNRRDMHEKYGASIYTYYEALYHEPLTDTEILAPRPAVPMMPF